MKARNKSTYAIRLNGLPSIRSLEEFSSAIRLSKATLRRLSLFSNRHYYEYEINKSTGGKRTIASPSRELKAVQGWILNEILYKLSVSDHSKGFSPKQSIALNAAEHVNARSVLCMDISNFFGSIPSDWVHNVFSSVGYNPLICTILTNFTTYKKCIPQGAPTSPMLANLCSWHMDGRLGKLALGNGLKYTRYADDLTFSSVDKISIGSYVGIVKYIVQDCGFLINNKKTRHSSESRRRAVTGLVLYDDKFGIGREYYKRVRAMIHSLHRGKFHGEISSYLLKVNGHLSYINSVDIKRYNMLLKYISNTVSKNANSHLLELNVISINEHSSI